MVGSGLLIYFRFISVFNRALAKLSSFGYSALALCVGKNQMCLNVRLAFRYVWQHIISLDFPGLSIPQQVDKPDKYSNYFPIEILDSLIPLHFPLSQNMMFLINALRKSSKSAGKIKMFYFIPNPYLKPIALLPKTAAPFEMDPRDQASQ